MFQDSETRCPKCGITTHKWKGILSKKLEPITNENVLKGVCRSCSNMNQTFAPTASAPTYFAEAHPTPSAPALFENDEAVALPTATAVPDNAAFAPVAYAEAVESPIQTASTIDPSIRSELDKKGLRFTDDKLGSGTYIGQTSIYNKRVDRGTMYYDNGNKYSGQWANDKMHGDGVFYYPSGARYEGTWLDGNRERSGYYYHPDGKVDVRAYRGDECRGKGARWSADRQTVELLNNGIPKNIISLAEGNKIANSLRLNVPIK
ncbi:hypothetical protein CTEN210_12492 [Chaetoceros tenuissimus]|uniref:MORN repeat protein n=1 Tax=Chaetoceros tenuissimus TaxID=426638 RepID=A0AAD3D3D0_9STRA|nr:hypothetical protein CTEN210_12492 [Chaetoceros tenuissimus]